VKRWAAPVRAAIQSFTKSNAGLIKSLSPLLLTFAGLLPTIKAAASSMHDLTMTADDYDKFYGTGKKKIRVSACIALRTSRKSIQISEVHKWRKLRKL
jgi:hypothetical protein